MEAEKVEVKKLKPLPQDIPSKIIRANEHKGTLNSLQVFSLMIFDRGGE